MAVFDPEAEAHAQRFTVLLGRVLRVSKAELAKREAEWKKAAKRRNPRRPAKRAASQTTEVRGRMR